MATTVTKQKFTQGTITITLASLANANNAFSSTMDNSTDLYIGVDVQIKFKTGTVPGSPSGTGTLDVYLLRCIDGTGTLFDDPTGATGSINTATLIDTFPATTSATTQVFSMSIEVVPSRWKLLVRNSTGGTLDATGGNFSVIFEGKHFQTV